MQVWKHPVLRHKGTSFFSITIFFCLIMVSSKKVLNKQNSRTNMETKINVLSRVSRGSFTNNVDKFLAFFDHLLNPLRWQFLPYERWHFWTTYPPLLVNVVCERPRGKNLSMPLWQEKFLVVLLTPQSQLKRHHSR